MASPSPSSNTTSKVSYHAEGLPLPPPNSQNRETDATVEEGLKRNELKIGVNREISEKATSSEVLNGETAVSDIELRSGKQPKRLLSPSGILSQWSTKRQAGLHEAVPPQRTNPLFPPLPRYGPASVLQNLQCFTFRISSFFLSLTFLGTIVLGSLFTSLPLLLRHAGMRLMFRNPNKRRKFHDEEEKRRKERNDAARAWKKRQGRPGYVTRSADGKDEENTQDRKYEPMEGGKDALICDVGYYARRVGLDVEEFQVQTEDGFIIALWHIYNPLEYTPALTSRRTAIIPEVFSIDFEKSSNVDGSFRNDVNECKRKYPVLLVHGLLQSAGAYCTNDDDSLAFYLCKRYVSNFGSPKVH